MTAHVRARLVSTTNVHREFFKLHFPEASNTHEIHGFCRLKLLRKFQNPFENEWKFWVVTSAGKFFMRVCASIQNGRDCDDLA